MGFKKRLGGSSFLLFSALCGIAGSSVASAAGAEERDVAVEKQNLANKDADDVDDGDIDVDLDEEVAVKKEARNIAGNVAKIIIASSIIAGAAGGVTYLAMNPEARKKALDYVLVQSGILGRIEDIKKQVPDFEKMIDEMIAKREAEKEKKQKEQEIADQKEFEADVETVLPTAGWRKDKIRWILGVFGVSLPKTAEGSRALAIVRDWLLVCGEDSNSVVFNALYVVAMALWLINSIALVVKDPDILSKYYLFKSPFMVDKKNQGSPWKHRAKVAAVQLADGALSFVFPGWAFLRQGLNVAGSIGTWLMKKTENVPGEGFATKAELDAAINRVNEKLNNLGNNLNNLGNNLNNYAGVVNAINKNFKVIADADKEKYDYDGQNMVLTAKNK